MADLRAAERLTGTIKERAAELRTEISSGDVDFRRIVTLADDIAETADLLASTFGAIDDVLQELGERPATGREPEQSEASLLDALSPQRAREEAAAVEEDNGLTRQELYERAKRAGIPGRSRMSKEQLEAALHSRGGTTS
jgi:hypothetical protein